MNRRLSGDEAERYAVRIVVEFDDPGEERREATLVLRVGPLSLPVAWDAQTVQEQRMSIAAR